MISYIRTTKKISSLLLISILSACGGDASPPRDVETLTSTMSAQHASVKISYSAPGERRAYDTIFSESGINGISRVRELNSFQFNDTEVRFPDISLSFDKTGSAGKIYRLYQAAFGRTPDVRGFGYWKDAYEKNGQDILSIAEAFLGSSESSTLYGQYSTNAIFIEKLYLNVLKRAPDSAGSSYWTNRLASGAKRGEILLAFADSPENKTATSPAIDAGMAFAQPGIAYIPVSTATGPGDVAVAVPFQLSGSNSTDANGDVLTYRWTIVKKPDASYADFVDPYIKDPKISLDIPGSYEIHVVTSDSTSSSYSPGKIIVLAHAIAIDSGAKKCSTLTTGEAKILYSTGHTYLDRNKNGIACDEADVTYEKSPAVPSLADTGRYTCSSVSAQTAFLLYLQGHTYLDRDRDGKPCEAKDIALELPVYNPPTYTPPVIVPSIGKKCWVNGYRRKNGTYVNGYYRSC